MTNTGERTPLLPATPFQHADTQIYRGRSVDPGNVVGVTAQRRTSHPLWAMANLPLDSDGSYIPEDFAFHDANSSLIQPTGTQEIWAFIRTGGETYDLIENYPGKVISAIRQHGVRKLGDIEIEDHVVKHVFGKREMLFRTFDTAEDILWEQHWKDFFTTHSEHRVDGGHKGWKNKIVVTAYVVVIKNAAGDIGKGLLHPLLLKYSNGTLPPSVFSLPAIQAVINFKWNQWASIYVLVEFLLYLCWLGFYTVFICLYQILLATSAICVGFRD